MTRKLILASQSETRQRLLTTAGVPYEARPARIDEAAICETLIADKIPPRDIADTLADAKAKKLSTKNEAAFVLGCDQVLAHGDAILSKPRDLDEARAQLLRLRGTTHHLFSAAVIYEGARPVWRHVGEVRLTMRDFSEQFLEGYLERNWNSIRNSVGAYKLEEEGVRLFSRVQGDYFHVLGMPLLEVLTYLGLRGVIET